MAKAELSSLPAGNYFLKIKTGKTVGTYPVIKK